MLVYIVFQFYPRFDFIFLSVFGFETKRKKLNQFARVYKIKTQLIKQLLTISSLNQLFK